MTDTNSTETAVARQAAFGGTLPAIPDWRIFERTEIRAYGNNFTKTAPARVSRNRNPRKKRTTAADSPVELLGPFDFDSVLEFSQGFSMGSPVGAAYQRANRPVAATGVTITAPGLTQEMADQIIANQTIIGFKGFGLDENNGARVAQASGVLADTTISVLNMVTEDPRATNERASAYIAGVRGAAGDIQMDANGDIISAALDFTTLPLIVGQAIHVGGVDTVNNFATPDNTGFAIVKAIEANKITLEKRDAVFVADTGAGVQIDLLYGPYIRNYAIDDPNFLDLYYMFSLKTVFPAQTTYEYAKDNAPNVLTIDIQKDGFVNLTIGFVGSITDNPSTVEAAGLADAAVYTATQEFATATDLIRLGVYKIDESGLLTDFDNLTLTINNNRAARKSLGSLAATQINRGLLDVTTEGVAVFTDPDIIEHIRCDRESSLRLPLWNDDGGIYIHMPKMGLEGGGRNYPINESVTINANGYAYNDDASGAAIEFTFFPVLPARPCA